ncbi:MAG: hypothetical protein Q8R53_02915, partial [Nanoarchaeota archaeon]|nr:hypothetical protein [Nanoarchaeota archaeon]
GGAPVAYGIRQEQSDPPNLYPCNTPLFPDSGFCPYRFPDITVGFGELAFPSIRSYEKDLENFLKKEAVSCVKEWIQDEIYPGAQIVGEETVQMHVDITDTSLVIDARYPLTFEAAGQEFFHLSEFGFVYSSKLGSFLKAAIIEPLRLEKKYVDFDYERDVMKEEGFNYGCPNNELHGFCPHATFADVLNRLQVSLDVAIPDEATGDTVFTFLVQEPNAIIKNQPTYAFSIAVQNRPPALDYVGESQCQDTFDVLVVQDRQEDLVLPLSAQDPDDDELLAYTLRSDGIGHAKVQDNALFIPLARLQTVSPNTYTVSVGVSDVYAAEDWQDIRIFVTGSLLESCP